MLSQGVGYAITALGYIAAAGGKARRRGVARAASRGMAAVASAVVEGAAHGASLDARRSRFGVGHRPHLPRAGAQVVAASTTACAARCCSAALSAAAAVCTATVAARRASSSRESTNRARALAHASSSLAP